MRVRRRDELRTARRIDTVEAGRHRRRTTDAQVHLARAGCLHHLDDLAARRSADDRVVEQDDALAFEDAAHRVELDPDAEVADRLLRLDERPADVVVADQPHLHRQARLLREADRRADARVGDGHDDIGGDRRLARQDAAEIGADLVHAAAEDIAVGPGEVHVLEDAVRERLRRERLDRPEPAVADDEQLAGLDVANVRARR